MDRVPFQELISEFQRVLLKKSFSAVRAESCAELFAKASLDGVASHGLNRFAPFIKDIEKGLVDVQAVPKAVKSVGALEQWDGQLGPGNLNAQAAMERSIDLASIHGIGLVAMRNTNHWMRGGNYGWQAADKGYIGICFTNTKPNMPAWGGKEPVIGNNPLIIALPRSKGHIVLDSAQSQFSFGAISNYARNNELLPFYGGHNIHDQLTKSPEEIEESQRSLPAGFWKGSGMSIVLDLITSTLAMGKNTFEIGQQSKDEYGISQTFIAINPLILGELEHYEESLEKTIKSIKNSTPIDENEQVYYPGERTLQARTENTELGVPVDREIWQAVKAL
ncbi:MAG: 3-dehydro-L-gulonate 2-dehydrogenase [Cyclobacteriaceae bacterium]